MDFDDPDIWGVCAQCGRPIKRYEVYRKYEDDAICYDEDCITEYAKNLFYELSTREVAN